MKNDNISKERQIYLNKIKKEKILVFLTQILILASFIAIWEILANLNIIDSFITSKPSRIFSTLSNLTSNNLLHHIGVTVFETVIGFVFGTILGGFIAIILWWSNFLAKVTEPFLVVLNSLPKVALRTSYNNLGWSRYAGYNSDGYGNFFSSYNFRNIKWIYKNR